MERTRVGGFAHQLLNQQFAAQQAVPRVSDSITSKNGLVGLSGATLMSRDFMVQLQYVGKGAADSCNEAEHAQGNYMCPVFRRQISDKCWM
jgi:hypothetical protein